MANSLCLFSAIETLFFSRVKSSFRVSVLFSKRVILACFLELSLLILLRLLSNSAILLFRESISTPLIICFNVDRISMIQSFMVWVNESNQNYLFRHQSQSGIWQCLNPSLYSQSWRSPSWLSLDGDCFSCQHTQTRTSAGLRQ